MRMSVIAVLLLFLAAMVAAQEAVVTDSTMSAAPPGPPTNVKAFDTPADRGHSITLTWDLSADDGQGRNNVIGYRIMRTETPEGPFEDRGLVPPGATTKHDSGVKEKEDPAYFPRNHDFYYKVVSVSSEGTEAESEVVGPVQAVGQWFNPGKWPVLVFVALFTIFTLYFITRARKGAQLYVRPLPGIDAVDEAIGRATEMGKPILYILGLGTASDIATIASFTILGRVAKKVAQHKTSLIVPCYDPIVMTIAQETVKTSY